MALYLAKNYPSSKLVLWDCDESGNLKTTELVKEMGVDGYSYTVDISDRIQVEQRALQVTIYIYISLKRKKIF